MRSGPGRAPPAGGRMDPTDAHNSYVVLIEHWISRANSAFDRGELVAALMDYRRVLREHPDFADVRNGAGLCLALLGDLAEALAEFDAALEINAEYREALLHRAVVLSELGRYEEARAAFNRLREIDESDRRHVPGEVGDRIANLHAELGDLYRVAGDADRAGEVYRRALTLRPTFLDIRSRLGEVYLEQEELPRAREELEAILTRNPDLTGARLHLGVVLNRLGLVDEATREWRRCAEEDPRDLRASAYLASVGADLRQEAAR